MRVEVAIETSSELNRLFDTAMRQALSHRGGPALLSAILEGRSSDAFLSDAVSDGSILVALDGDIAVGFALCRDGVLEAVYVAKHSRRRGVARSLVKAAVRASGQQLDAFALPGDRATKSLFESLGWKARLLTMRAE